MKEGGHGKGVPESLAQQSAQDMLVKQLRHGKLYPKRGGK
jgi:hypothetical protein